MSEYLSFRDGGKTNEEGISRLAQKLAGTQNSGVIGSTDLAASQNGTPNMSVNLAVGDIVIPYSSYQYHGWTDAVKNVTISASDATNPRIDRVVAYIDLSVVDSTNSNNPGALKFKSVAGTAAGSPTRPNDATVQSSVGSGNPFVNIADVRVEATVTSILDAKITDTRPLFQLGGGVGGAEFGLAGDLVVANDQTMYWIAPRAGTFLNIYARVKTAPTGADLNIRVNKNGVSFKTVSITAGATNATSAIASGQFSAGDYFSLDITQIGSTISGADLTVALG